MTATPAKQPFVSTTPGVLLACLLACLLWGSAFPAIKVGYQLFAISSSDVPALLVFAGARFTISGVMAVLAMSLARRKLTLPTRSDLHPIATLALFQTILQYVFFYVGLSHAAGVTSSILEASNSFLIVILAALVFRTERLTLRKALGCAIGFAGVVLVNLGGTEGLSFSLAGEGMILVSTVAAAISSNLSKCYATQGHDPVLLSGWQFVLGGLVMLAVGLALGGRIAPADPERPLPAIALLVYLGFISAAAYSLWSLALAHNPVSRVAVFGFMNPVFGAMLSALILGEGDVLDPWVAAAALALVSAGIVIVNRTPAGGGQRTHQPKSDHQT